MTITVSRELSEVSVDLARDGCANQVRRAGISVGAVIDQYAERGWQIDMVRGTVLCPDCV